MVALREIFRRVVGLKPRDHEFNAAYRPGRHMTAIGG